jgi:hypothetical protein
VFLRLTETASVQRTFLRTNISCVHFLQGGNRGLRGILEEREDDKHLSVHNGARTTGIMYH